MSLYSIIEEPVITEKIMLQREFDNKVSFFVSKSANKIEIKKAVEKIFNVTVENVSVLNVKGKPKKQGKFEGFKRDRKKAIIKLKEGDKIDYFEGA